MILSKIETRTRKLLGNVSTTDFTDANIDESVEQYYHAMIVAAIEASGEWRVAGEIATADLVADQDEYTLPTDILTIERVEVNYTAGTNTWEVARIIDDRVKQDAISNADATFNATPTVYLHDSSLFFTDAPTAAAVGGLKVWYSKEPTSLSDATEPNLPESTHDGLVYGACLDFSIERKLDREIELFKTLYNEKLEEVKAYYANRTKAKRIKFRPRTESYS